MPMTQKQMIKYLKQHGGILVKGGKGSHVRMRIPSGYTVTIPNPRGQLKIGTENNILKAAGLK